MTDGSGLVIQVLPNEDVDAEQLGELSASLRRDLLETDVESVGPVIDTDVPAGAKGLAEVMGWLAVKVGAVGHLRSVVTAARDWSARTSRTVEITYGTDVLKVTGVTSAQQERLIDDWLARQGRRP